MGNVMGKQKFCCKGVLRSTGQRASIMVSADNKEAAVQIANQHGLLVDSAMPVAEPAPQPPAIVNKNLDDRIEDILSAEDEDLPGGPDDLDLDEDLGGAPTSSGSPSTKACPYCGEQILAVAVKCKHCGSYVGEKAARTRQPSGDAPPKTDAHGVVSLISGIMAFFVFVVGCLLFNFYAWITYPITFLFAVAGFVSGLFAKGNLRVAGIFLNILAAIPGIAAFVVLIVGLVVQRAVEQNSGVVKLAEAAAPVATLPPPKPVIYKPSPEEMAFAGKLVAFLDSCDELAKLLEKGPKIDQYNKQCEAVKARCREIPPPPQGSSWAGGAAAASKRFVDATLGMLTLEVTQADAALEALHQSLGDSPEFRAAYRQAAEEVRKPVAAIRSQIPPACLAKPE
jgi:hypothetical protein